MPPGDDSSILWPFQLPFAVCCEHGCAWEAELPGSVRAGAGLLLPGSPARELPPSPKTGLALCISDFMLPCLQQGGVAERGFITIITIFVFLYHVQTSLFLQVSPLRTAEQFGDDTALVFIRQFGVLLSQPPNHEAPDIKTKQNSWGSFYALQDLRCHPAGLSSSQGLLFQTKAKIPARPRVLLGVFAEHNPDV